MRSLRAARVLLREVLVPESVIAEPEVEFELRMLESVEVELLIVELELFGLVEVLPDDVEGAVIVLASVERPVLGVVDIVPEVEPVLGVVDIVLEPVDPVGAAEPGLVVPVLDGVVAVGLVEDGAVLVPLVLPEEVCACAMPTAPISAAIEAAAVRDLENLIIGRLLFERLKNELLGAPLLRRRRGTPWTASSAIEVPKADG